MYIKQIMAATTTALLTLSLVAPVNAAAIIDTESNPINTRSIDQNKEKEWTLPHLVSPKQTNSK